MATKDNQSKRSDPGTAKTKSKPSQAKRPKHRKEWKRPHWVSYALEVGIEDAGKKTIAEIKSVLKHMIAEGELENQRGGEREGAGRKKATVLEAITSSQEMIAEHATTEIEVKVLDEENPGETKKVKMTRTQALMAKLFAEGIKGNVSAANSYLDRHLGRAKQSIEHSGEIKTEEQNVPTREESAAAAAYEKALEEGRPVLSPLNK